MRDKAERDIVRRVDQPRLGRLEPLQHDAPVLTDRRSRVPRVSVRSANPVDEVDLTTPSGLNGKASVVMEPAVGSPGTGDTTEKFATHSRKLRSGAIVAAVDLVLLLLLVAGETVAGSQSLLFGFTFTAVMMVTLFLARMHRTEFTVSFLADLPRLLLVVLAVSAALGWVFVGLNLTTPTGLWRTMAVMGLVLIAGRALSYLIVNRLRASNRFRSTVVVVGAGSVGRQLGDAISGNPKYGLELIGYVDDKPYIREDDLPAPVLGSVERLAEVLGSAQPQQVLIAFPNVNTRDLVDRVRSVDRLAVEISVVPRFFELSSGVRASDEIDRIPLDRLRRTTYRSLTWPLKRVLDVAIAGFLLLLLTPLLAVLAFALRRESGSGVIFRQERVGVDDRQFVMLKLRSLRPVDENESATRWSIRHDDRMTSLGRFIRRTSLDELPQLWNIVRGDMSLVGPRPERPHFADRFAQDHRGYGQRHRVPSGLTGWAQIHGLRGDTSIEERARYDNYYIENWSLWLDLTILLRTFTNVMNGSG